MRRFEGRNAVVTGAGGGIGTAIAQRLADEGAHVVVCDAVEDLAHVTTDAILASGASASTAVFDVSDPGAVKDFAERLLAERGHVDVLVNNAGINRRGPLLDLSDDDWHTTMAVNVDSMFHMCRAFLPAMVSAGHGAIVNTGSQWGMYPAPGHIAYNVSKAAVIAFSQNLARDYAPAGIRVNVVCPCEILTPMVESGLGPRASTSPIWPRRCPSVGWGARTRSPHLWRFSPPTRRPTCAAPSWRSPEHRPSPDRPRRSAPGLEAECYRPRDWATITFMISLVPP